MTQSSNPEIERETLEQALLKFARAGGSSLTAAQLLENMQKSRDSVHKDFQAALPPMPTSALDSQASKSF